jgi:hypothetical protein
MPVAINPRLTDSPRAEEVTAEVVLEFGASDGEINRAARPRRTFEFSLPTEYVVVPLAASSAQLVPVPAGMTVRADITADIAPLIELLGVDNLGAVASRLEVGAVAYGSELGDVQLSAGIDSSALQSGRLILELTVTAGRGEEPTWSPTARRAATEFVATRSDAMAVVVQDRNGWFHMSPLAMRDFSCEVPCDSSGTCTAECDARCCIATATAEPSSRSWLWLLLLALLIGAAAFAWSRRYPDPRGLRLAFESSTGPREVRLFKHYSPWRQPLAVLPEEALEAGAKLKARCLRDGTVELKAEPTQLLRAGSRPAAETVVFAEVKGTARHAADLEFVASGATFESLYVPEDKKAR